ncbi:hypothetical protein CEQ90_15365 [Lewinellaceae bacterium SD302]|nr:hypothetical protein CEQ90_15365 [Lewinellaceae bacterium SD302]
MRIITPLFLLILLSACIGDDFVADFVQPELRITSTVDSITVDSSYQFEATFFNNVGQAEAAEISWSSSDAAILSITNSGLATARAFGPVTVSASFFDGENELSQSVDVHTSENVIIPPEPEVREGQIMTTSTYVMEGAFTISEITGGGIMIEIAEDYRADDFLPGLYVYLSNNANTTAGAYEIGAVSVFEGAHSYEVPDVGINDYQYLLYFCAPFNVDVGNGRYNE